MTVSSSSSSSSNNNSSLPWHNYDPNGQRQHTGDRYNHSIPNSVTHLRIGFIEYQQLLEDRKNGPPPLKLPSRAFMHQRNLKHVQIYLPAVSRIGDNAFDECRQLEQVEFVLKPPQELSVEDLENALPSKLESIGVGAFFRCLNLQSLVGLEFANESLRWIGDGAFDNCKSLVDVDFLSSLTRLQTLGEKAYSCNKALVTVDLSKAVFLTEVQCYSFSGCSKLISVLFPPYLCHIAEGAFWGCSALQQVDFPLNLQHMGVRAFQGCRNLRSVVLPSCLQQIGQHCFKQCNKLAHVALPSSHVRFLKQKSLESCKSLSLIELPNPVPRHQWPLILEQFCKEDGVATVDGGIPNLVNRNTIVWNFLRQNLAQLFIDSNAAIPGNNILQQHHNHE